MYNAIFFTNVMRLLQDQGMTKRQLADRAGMSVSFLSDLTTGKGNPSLLIMENLADALGVPLPVLLESTDLSPPVLEHLGHEKHRQRPDGLRLCYALLTEYQAFVLKGWDEENRREKE